MKAEAARFETRKPPSCAVEKEWFWGDLEMASSPRALSEVAYGVLPNPAPVSHNPPVDAAGPIVVLLVDAERSDAVPNVRRGGV